LDRLENITTRSFERPSSLAACRPPIGGLASSKVDFRIALVGGDDEAVFVGQVEQRFPVGQRQHLAGRVARRADVEQLHARPFFFAQAGVVEGKVVVRQVVQEAWLGAGQVGRAFVDLVERVGADDQRHMAAARVDDGLGEGEQRLARAIDRQDLGFRIQCQSVAALAPGGDGLTQRRDALRRRVIGQTLQSIRQRFHDESRCGVLRFADGELDLVVLRVRGDAGEQGAQLFEGVGLELGEVWIHVGRRMGVKSGLSLKTVSLPQNKRPIFLLIILSAPLPAVPSVIRRAVA
jgi:hypothetical protein